MVGMRCEVCEGATAALGAEHGCRGPAEHHGRARHHRTSLDGIVDNAAAARGRCTRGSGSACAARIAGGGDVGVTGGCCGTGGGGVGATGGCRGTGGGGVYVRGCLLLGLSSIVAQCGGIVGRGRRVRSRTRCGAGERRGAGDRVCCGTRGGSRATQI